MAMAAGVVLMAVGAGSGASGEIELGRDKRDIERFNAETDEMKAADAIVRGEEQVKRLRQSTKKLLGSQRVAFGAAGVVADDPDSSAMDLYEDTAVLAENDVITLRANAAREAWGFKRSAEEHRKKGAMEYEAGKNRAIAGLLNVGGKALAGSG